MSLVDAVARSVVDGVSRKQRSYNPSQNLVPGANHVGGTPKKPRKGAKGIAGVRADIRDGVITPRDFGMLSLREISTRYRVRYPGSAALLRDTIALGRY